MYQSLVPQVLSKYGITYKKILKQQKGYRNESYPVLLADDNLLNLIFYKREIKILERIKRADIVSGYLYDVGMPVRNRYDRRTVIINSNGLATFTALYNYLPGQTISWESYTTKHIKLLGRAMSDMHYNLRQMPSNDLINQNLITGELRVLIYKMIKYFYDESVKKALKDKLQLGLDINKLISIRRLLRSLADMPDQQAIHMDMVRGNVLFDSSNTDDFWQMDGVAISGIIDFEKTVFANPIFDIARTLAFLLVDCVYKNQSKVYDYFLYSGYIKRGQARFSPNDSHNVLSYHIILDSLICLFLIHDFYKFLIHTPYESLIDNHHFVRTRDILINRAVIIYS